MKKILISISIITVLASAVVYALSLNTVDSFGVLGSTVTDTSSGTIINGNAGWTTPPATTPTVSGVTHIADVSYIQLLSCSNYD